MKLINFLWTILLVAGIAGGFFLGKTNQTTMSEQNPEVTFSRDMIYHHEQAVEMALIIRDRTQEKFLKSLSLDILLTQQNQIGRMQGWLGAWGRPLNGEKPPMDGMGEMMGMASRGQVNALQTDDLAKAEISFLQLMIRHHQGGVFMAEELLKEAKNEEVRRLAETIVAGQTKEIAAMTEMLKTRNAAPLAPLEHMNH